MSATIGIHGYDAERDRPRLVRFLANQVRAGVQQLLARGR